MSIDTRTYAYGTRTVSVMPFGLFRSARVLCTDGRIRSTVRLASTADTFFSVPASVRVDGRTVSGYLTVETLKGSDVATRDDPAVVKFAAYTYGRNADALPAGTWTGTRSDLEIDAPVSRRDGIAYLTTDPVTGESTGHLDVPCSRYGRTSRECAPIAWRVAYLSSVHGDGRPVTRHTLDHAMGLVANDSDSVADTVRAYGHRQYT